MNKVIIVQARMGSTRLPGKIMKKILNKPLLEYQIERLQRIENKDRVVIATTTNPHDDEIVDFCEKRGISYFRGSEEDVLSRYHGAAEAFKADIVIRLTSDCPVIDPTVVDQVICFYLENDYDYASNTLQRTYPRGMDTEVISFSLLSHINQEAKSASDREHVTRFIYNNPNKFKLGNLLYKSNESHHRWTVDTLEDFSLIEKIITALYPDNHKFTLENTLELLKENTDWLIINQHIEQKKI